MKYSREVQIGAALVTAAAIFYFGHRFFRDLPLFAGTHTYTTVAQDAAGIIEGSPVRVNGVYVGTVTGVGIADGAAQVDFTVSDKIRLPHGTTAVLGGFGFIGDVRMDLMLGPPDTTFYAPGDLIPVNAEESLLSRLSAEAHTLLQQLDSLLSGANGAVSAARVQLDNPESSLRQTVQAVGTSAEAFRELLNRESAHLGAAIEDIRTLAEVLTALAADSLAHTAEGLNRAVTKLQRNLDTLEETTAALNMFLQGINRGQGTLGLLATDDALYHEATHAAAALRRVLEEFEQNPRRYLKELRLVDIF